MCHGELWGALGEARALAVSEMAVLDSTVAYKLYIKKPIPDKSILRELGPSVQ